MARKLDTNQAPGAGEAPGNADALEILHPEREVRLWGDIVTVREYGFFEGWTIQRTAAPILDQLMGAADAGESGLDQILASLAEQPELLLHLVAEACIDPLPSQATDADKTARAAQVDAFAARLRDDAETGDTEGQALLMTWWNVNSGFFVRRVVRRLAGRHAKQALESRMSIGSTSSSQSPAQAGNTSPARSATDTPSAS